MVPGLIPGKNIGGFSFSISSKGLLLSEGLLLNMGFWKLNEFEYEVGSFFSTVGCGPRENLS